MAKQKPELTAYELRDGAYGMYLAKDGFAVDVDFGSFVYSKEQVDAVLSMKDAEIARLKKRLKKRKALDIADASASSPTGKCFAGLEFTEKDAEIQALKQKLATYGDTNARLVNENTGLKLALESKDAEVAQLRCNIAELQDRLRASEKQNEDIINSASQIMILQDALANKERQG